MALPTLQREPAVSSINTSKHSAPMNLGDIFWQAGLTDDMAIVEHRLLELTASRSPQLAEAGAHTVAAGGKRLRAALVLLAAQLGTYDITRAIHPAAAVELLHGASLIHDDLVDHTDRRRGHVTVHTRWNSNVALMLGDYFFALSANELASERDPRIIRFYADAVHTIVEGELSPVKQITPTHVALEQYFYKTGRKTAALFVAACKAGITVADGTPEQIDALGAFGYDLGVAFQIVDDVLDFIGSERTLGKPAGNDLREGTWTLPLIYAVANSADPLLHTLATTGHVEPNRVPQLVEAVVASGGIARAMDEARMISMQALRRLDSFPASATTRTLEAICEFVLARTT